MIADRNRIYDGWLSLEGGVDAGRGPTLIDPNQAASAENVTFRGGPPRPRPGWRQLTETFTNPTHGYNTLGVEIPHGDPVAERFQAQYAYKNEVFQTICAYSPHKGEDCLMALIGGRLFKIVPSINSARVTEITVYDAASPYKQPHRPAAPPPPGSHPPPSNDAFGNSQLISGETGMETGTCVGATTQAGEPPVIDDPIAPAYSSVWYTWFGITDNAFQYFSVDQPNYFIQVFTGTVITGLTRVKSAQSPQQCVFHQVKDTRYHVRVSPFNSSLAAEFILRWNAVTPVPPFPPSPAAYRNNKTYPIAYMVQADKFLIAQDGISKAIIYDGKRARRSALEGLQDTFEVPTGTMMAYGMGRLCVVVNDRDIAFGDLYGSHLDKQTDPADSIILFTERNFLTGGFDAAIPFQQGVATGIQFFPQLDTSTGNGQLLVFAERGAASFNMAIDRTLWQTSLFQVLALLTTGMRGHRSIAVVNEDLWFRSDDGYRNYRQARSEATGYAHIPVSTNVGQFLDKDEGELLKFTSSMYFDNRVIGTCSPAWDIWRWGNLQESVRGRIYHNGLVVVDFDILSSFGTERTRPAWEGHWTIGNVFTSSLPNIKIAQVVTGTFNGVTRAFAFGLLEERDPLGRISYQNQLYELSFDDRDDFCGSIPWELVTRGCDFRGGTQAANPFTENELYDGDIWISEVSQGGIPPGGITVTGAGVVVEVLPPSAGGGESGGGGTDGGGGGNGGGGGGGGGGGVPPPDNYTSDDIETTLSGTVSSMTHFFGSGDTSFSPGFFVLEPGNYTSDDLETTTPGSVSSLTNFFAFGDTSFSGSSFALVPGNYASDDLETTPAGSVASLTHSTPAGDTSLGTGSFVDRVYNFVSDDFQSYPTGSITSLTGGSSNGDTTFGTGVFV